MTLLERKAMKVSEVYEKYMIPKNLQEHMLRVGGLAEIVLEWWKGMKIDKKSVVFTGLFHDVAKPMKFDPARQAQFGLSETDIARLIDLQKRLVKEYGSEEHNATVEICREIGLSPNSVKYVDNLEWKHIPRLLQEDDVAALIPIYCDMRVGPKGILSLNQRLVELKDRTGEIDYDENQSNGNAIEKLIQDNTDTDLNAITEEGLSKRFETLLKWEI